MLWVLVNNGSRTCPFRANFQSLYVSALYLLMQRAQVRCGEIFFGLLLQTVLIMLFTMCLCWDILLLQVRTVEYTLVGTVYTLITVRLFAQADLQRLYPPNDVVRLVFCALLGTHVTSVSRQREFFPILFEFFGKFLSFFGNLLGFFAQTSASRLPISAKGRVFLNISVSFFKTLSFFSEI